MKEVLPCERVTERIALGEPLGELSEHVASCASCRQLVEMPGRIAAGMATAGDDPASDPGLGFSARMTVGAQHRIAVRRRRRIAGTAAAAVAACAVGVFALTRSSGSHDDADHTAAVANPSNPAADDRKPIVIPDDELAGLVRLADTDRAMHYHAPWSRIERPLRPYIQLVNSKGVAP